MINVDEDALICDLAETYHIYDYRSLPLKMVATFSVGLRENSRIKMALAEVKYPFDTLLLASIYDCLNLRNWAMTRDAQNGNNAPQSLTNKLLGLEEKSNSEYMLFNTAEEFNQMWNKDKKTGGV